ncbi:hypothetical protein OG21DRAFT_1416760, partial [Imleria badia]
IFDYAITLEDEGRWVWGRNWDVTRLVFTVSRYLPFAGAGLTAYCGFVHMLGIVAAEGPLSRFTPRAAIPNVVCRQVLLILRTYAYWQGNKFVLYGVLAYGAVSSYVSRSSLDSSVRRIEQSPPGCYLTAGRNGTLLALLLLVFEMVILSLTVYKYFRSYRDLRLSIAYTIYRDGIFYIVCIILITLANTIVTGALPVYISLPRHAYRNVYEKPQITLHSVLASRIMFNLRESSDRAHAQKLTTMDSMRFNDEVFHRTLNSRTLNSESNEFELFKRGRGV